MPAHDPIKTVGEWDINKERAHVEDLVNKRLTAFLAFFTVVSYGAINNESFRLIILLFGCAICYLLAETIVRAHRKLAIILSELNSMNDHPVAWTNRHVSGKSKFHYVGIWVPRVCTIALLFAAVLSASPYLGPTFNFIAAHLPSAR